MVPSDDDGVWFGQELVERVDEKRGPGLEVGPPLVLRAELLGGDEEAFEDVLFADADRSANRDDLDHPDVNGPDGIRVVVQQAERADVVLSIDLELFLELAPGPRQDGIPCAGDSSCLDGLRGDLALEVQRLDVASDMRSSARTTQ